MDGLHELPDKAGASIATGNRASTKKVEIQITSAPNVNVIVKLDGATLINVLPLATGGTPVAGIVTIPATFKMGFSSSTGLYTHFHEVRNLAVTSLQAAIDAKGDSYATRPGQTLVVPAANGMGSNDVNLPASRMFSVDTPLEPTQGAVTMNTDGDQR